MGASKSQAAEPGAQHDPPLLSIAPMMDWTDVHFRQLARLITKRTWLWTEMVVDKTIVHTDHLDSHLWYPPEQHPIVLQLGGSDPETIAAAGAKARAYGYDEVNLNCGCPSDRVAGAGCFGASLMLQPERVAQCMQALANELDGTPVTVKCRIGVDDVDDYAALHRFVATVAANSPVTHFIVHARKCLLSGLSPHQNRTVPPLRYHWQMALKRDFPQLDFTLNGGLQSPEETAEVLAYRGAAGERAHGVMIGRAAFHMPWQALARADSLIYGAASDAATSRRQVIADYCEYAAGMHGRWYVKEDGYKSPSLRVLIKPLLNLFHGERKGKRWKAEIDKVLLEKPPPESVAMVMQRTLHVLDDDVLDSPPSAVTPAIKLFTAEQTGEWPPPEMPAPPVAAPVAMPTPLTATPGGVAADGEVGAHHTRQPVQAASA